MQSRIFSDPVHGFITVDGRLLLSLIQSPELQRLRRIRQLGVGYLVFPGAEHSRFGHALGAMALMDDALTSLAQQGVNISGEEREAAKAAALLHDIGHGPFSHTLETDLIDNFRHEDMSRVLLSQINKRLDGQLDLALQIFDGTYRPAYFHQLVSSQLDMDRLDYLRRDSYYTGVMEGVIGVSRILKMMRPVDNDDAGVLAFDKKATYTIENFLQARRFMYWQVYLHRSVIAGDHLLKSILRKARHLSTYGELHGGSEALMYFIRNRVDGSTLSTSDVWMKYCELDDSDILYSIKQWRKSDDRLLSDLCDRFINRRLPKVRFIDNLLSESNLNEVRAAVSNHLVASGLSNGNDVGNDIDYYFHSASVTHNAYDSDSGSINLLGANGRLQELSEAENTLTVSALTNTETRHYIAVPNELTIDLE